MMPSLETSERPARQTKLKRLEREYRETRGRLKRDYRDRLERD